MAINKNFVVKNGFEVNQKLILADADTNKVGIGTSQPKYLLDVAGGIGVTDVYAVGFATFTKELNVGIDGAVLTALGIGSVGVGTAMPSYLLDIRSPVSTGQTALYVQGDVRITGDLNVDDITFDDATVQDLRVQETLFVGADGGAGIATIKQLNVSGLTTTNELITYGISTFRNYARFIDGQQLYFGDGSDLNIYHDGSNSYIQEQGVGNLYIQSNAGSINIRTNTSESAFVANQDGSVELYYDNAKKFETLSTGSTVTGTLFTNQISSSGVSTVSAYYVNGTQVINNSRQLQNIVSLDATTTSTIEAAIANAPNTFSDLTVTGVSTLGVTSATQLTSQNLNVTGVATIATLNATNVTISGAAVTNFTVYNNLSVGGVSTFTNGPVLIGSATSTGTALQRLQVSGGSYFSGSVGISTTNPIQQFQVGSGTTVVVIDGSGDIGIAITNPTSKLHVVGDGIFTGVVTATTFNGQVNSGVSTITNLSGTNVNYSGVGTITTLNSTTGTVTNLSGTNVNYSGVGTITTLNSTTGTVTNLSGTNVNYSGIGTVVNLRSTTLNNTGVGTITTLNSTTGTITNLSGTNVNYSGIGTITTLVSTNANNTGVTTSALLNVGVGGTIITTTNTTRVGINSTSPAYTLDVRGDVNFSGSLRQGGTIFSSGVGIQSAGAVIGAGFTTLNFIGAGNTFAVNGTTIDISIQGGGGSSATQIIEDNFTVTGATQSLFTLSSTYESGYIDVYLNGVRLSNADYSETSTSSITLTSAAVLGDNVDVVNYKTTSFVGVTSVGFAKTAFDINISATTSTDTTTSVVLVANQSTGNQTPFIDSGLVYDANTNNLSSTTFTGSLSGNATGLSGSPSITVTGVNASGIITATSFIDDGTNLLTEINTKTSTGKAIAMAIVFGG